MCNVFLCASVGILTSLAVSVAKAQEIPQETPRLVETMTVVGQATNALITNEELDSYLAGDLADVFRLTPSISVGGSVGVAQKIYIRGLEDSLINVTVDGAPQASTLFHHIGRVTIDPELLQQVEVQAGAGEATSGAGAIGGAIRFKTKNADDMLDGSQSFGGKIKASHFSNKGRQTSASLYGRINERWGVLGYVKNLDSDNMVDGDGDDIRGSAADQSMAMVKINGAIGDHQSLTLSYEARDEEGKFSARPNWIVAQDAPLYPSFAERETAVVNYGIQQGDWLNLEVAAYQTDSSFRGGRFDWQADIRSLGLDIRNTNVFGIHRVIYGVDYRDDRVDTGPAVASVDADKHAEEGQISGVYTQVYSRVLDDLTLSYGARYDNYQYQQKILIDEYYGDPVLDQPAQTSSSEVSVNAGFSYKVTDALTFGLGYAEASRGKEIGDGFTIDGYLYDQTDAPVIDPDFVAETVSNIEASLEYTLVNFHAKVAIFNSQIDDVIYERSFGNSLYENIGTIESNGFEIKAAYQWQEFDLFLGFATSDSELDPADGLYVADFDSIALNGYEFIGLGNSRGDSWNIGVNYVPSTTVSMGFNINYVEELAIETLHQSVDLGWVPELYTLKKPSYTSVDLYTQWSVLDNVTLNLSVANVFDMRYRDHSSVGDYSAVSDYETVVGPLEAGRDIRLSVSLRF